MKIQARPLFDLFRQDSLSAIYTPPFDRNIDAYAPPSTILCIFFDCSSMSNRESRRLLAEGLNAAAANYQLAVVSPHCAECTKPCCRLDPLVLELDWKQLKAIWQLKDSRTAFDRRISLGTGPEEIRARDGLYYAHRKVCPAYDEAHHSCRVYDREIKPLGCTDFPVYQDRGSVVADLRCEAVNLDGLATWIARSVGREFRLVQSADDVFPFLVTLSVRRITATSRDST